MQAATNSEKVPDPPSKQAEASMNTDEKRRSGLMKAGGEEKQVKRFKQNGGDGSENSSPSPKEAKEAKGAKDIQSTDQLAIVGIEGIDVL